ncbi:MAG TPA: hypothetical protein VF257_00935 [Solirubrobacteraceae bacterium]
MHDAATEGHGQIEDGAAPPLALFLWALVVGGLGYGVVMTIKSAVQLFTG